MICSHDNVGRFGARSGILAKVEPLTIYSTQAKRYRIQTQNERQYESQCWEGRSPDQKAAQTANEHHPRCSEAHQGELFLLPRPLVAYVGTWSRKMTGPRAGEVPQASLLLHWGRLMCV
ncbi:hypothetical protein N431DRAFT_205029 [Stipitochalara longipes BDJ]|nr:hypothetical protein N431DRAFT_205029 [Stipitochalara longipes BDJ]